MSSFFTIPKSDKKRKRTPAASENPKKRIATPKGAAGRKQQPARSGPSASAHKDKHKSRRQERDESISGSDSDSPADDDTHGLADGFGDSDSSSDEEDGDSDNNKDAGDTAAERRLRLAERYLDNVKEEVQEVHGFDAEQIDRDLIAERLQEDVAETKGKVYRRLGQDLLLNQATHCLFRDNNDNVITSIATCAPYAYTTSKDMYLTKWRLQDLPQYQWQQTTRKKPKKPPAPPKRQPDRIRFTRGDTRKAQDRSFQGHTGPILAVAASQDGKFVVTAGADRRVVVHDARTLKPLRAFPHHRDAVTGLAFRRGTNQLFSSSKDRTVKVWSLDELAYVETLFGHQDDVVDVDALAQERCVSVGARDRTARLWKVVEETQLVFRGGGGPDSKKKMSLPAGVDPRSLAHEGSMDRIAMLDDELFVTGSDNGSISLWSTQKKKPLFVMPRAHGIDPALTPKQASGEINPDPSRVVPPPQPRWITALKTVPYSDLIISGSWDGCVRLWCLSEDKKRIEPLGALGTTYEEATLAKKDKKKYSGRSTSGEEHGDHDDDKAGVNGESGSSDQQQQQKQQQPKTNGTHTDGLTNGDDSSASTTKSPEEKKSEKKLRRKQQQKQQEEEQSQASESEPWSVPGIVNDISLFERGDRGRDGVCIVAAVAKEHRLGRWKALGAKARNGAVVFEIPHRLAGEQLKRHKRKMKEENKKKKEEREVEKRQKKKKKQQQQQQQQGVSDGDDERGDASA